MLTGYGIGLLWPRAATVKFVGYGAFGVRWLGLVLGSLAIVVLGCRLAALAYSRRELPAMADF